MSAPLLVGAAAYVLFALLGLRKAAGKSAGCKPLFMLGALMLAGATAALLLPLGGTWSVFRVFGAVWASFWLLLLVHVLFFSVLGGELYADEDTHTLCTTGAYALCRHPGSWCFLFSYLGLWLLAGTVQMGIGLVLFCGLSLAYIALQDFVLFPRYVAGFAAYREQTPFLFPSRRSIAAYFVSF